MSILWATLNRRDSRAGRMRPYCPRKHRCTRCGCRASACCPNAEAKVKAGQVIATVSGNNPYRKYTCDGVVESGVIFSKQGNSGTPRHACRANDLAPG